MKITTFKIAFCKIVTLGEDKSIVEFDEKETAITELIAFVCSGDRFREIDEAEVEKWTQCDKNEPTPQCQRSCRRSFKTARNIQNECQGEENDGTVSIKKVTRWKPEEADNVLLAYFEQRDSSDHINILHLQP